MLECEDGHEKARHFHETLIKLRDKHFPEKTVKISSFDKDWMHPELKSLHIQMTKEFFNNRKSEKWKKNWIKIQEREKEGR